MPKPYVPGAIVGHPRLSYHNSILVRNSSLILPHWCLRL